MRLTDTQNTRRLERDAFLAARAILAHARAQLASFKRIRRIEFFDLPKTISGKIRRVEPRQAELARDLGTRHAQEFWEDDFPASTHSTK